VVTRELEPTFTAALRFGGIPLDFEVTAAEKRLREALLRDGLEPKAGYRCGHLGVTATFAADCRRCVGENQQELILLALSFEVIVSSPLQYSPVLHIVPVGLGETPRTGLE
jgi:hypothetical protein